MDCFRVGRLVACRVVKKRFKLYLETSFWRRLVDETSDPRRIESYRFLRTVRKSHLLVVSTLVSEELERAPVSALRGTMKRRIRAANPDVLTISTAAEVADRLLSIQGRGKRDRPDMLHVACAMIHGIDALVSWDLHDLACGGTRKAVERIAAERRLTATYVGTPREVATWLTTA